MARYFAITCLTWVAIVWAAAVAHAAGPASAPSRPQPATRAAGPGHNSLLVKAPVAPDPLIADASSALDAGKLDEFQKNIEEQLAPMLADLDHADLSQITRLCVYREFARNFIRLKDMEPKDRDTLKWLLTQPRLCRTLMLAMADEDRPDGVLAILRFLHEDSGDQLASYPDLTTAFCVCWDQPTLENGKIDLPHVARLYHYYLNAAGAMRFDLQELPWQLSTYVVSNNVNEEQIAWALQKYRAYHGAIGHVYFDVPYDDDAFYSGAKERIDSHDYTLANLVIYGGVCKDQAHFATAVGRSVGVPITTCTGTSNDGVGHAWVGFLEVANGRVRWNFSEGRYADDEFWLGQVVSPQTGEALSDADVSLLAELQTSKPDDRDTSIALWKSRTITPPEQLLKLFVKAIELSPGNREAWVDLAQMGADRKLSADQMNAVMDVVKKFALHKYDSFAYSIFEKLVSGEGNPEQLASLDHAVDLFSGRPDLLADIRMRQADLLKGEKPDEALRAYGEVLTRYLNAGPIVYQAMMKVDAMLQASNDRVRLAAIYKQVWTSMPQPTSSAFVKTTAWYVIGEHYASLLDDLDQKQQAISVRARMESLVPAKQPWDN